MSNLATLKPFKKGDDPRRNTTGKNKGSRSLTKLLREALEAIADGQKDPYAELLVKKVMKMAIVDGNEQMIKLCFNYLEGMPFQPHTGADGKELPVPIFQIDNVTQRGRG